MTTADTTALLRLEVGRLRAAHRGRRFDTVVHLGHLGSTQGTCSIRQVDQPVLDAGTRTEVLSRLLEDRGAVSDGRASVWLTRPGEPSLQDEDLAWLSAAGRAFAALGHHLAGFWTVTRTGWLDVRTGEGRTWKRLRL